MKKRRPGAIAGEALRMLSSKPATINYPASKEEVPMRGYRGRLRYDNTECNGCRLCVKDCPADAIDIINIGEDGEKVFKAVIDLGRCIFCAQCVDSCRKKSLTFSNDFELAVTNAEDLKADI